MADANIADFVGNSRRLYSQAACNILFIKIATNIPTVNKMVCLLLTVDDLIR